MAIKFFLNNVEIHLQTNSAVTHTQDSTLDTVSFDTEFTTNGTPYLPMTPFEIRDYDEDDVLLSKEAFVVIADEVEIASKKQLLYIHHVVATQKTRELSKYILRNSVFKQVEQQPRAKTNIMGCVVWHNVSGNEGRWEWNKVFPFCATDISEYRPMFYAGDATLFMHTRIKSARLYIMSFASTFEITTDSGPGDHYYKDQRDWKVNNWTKVKVRISIRSYENPDYELASAYDLTVLKSDCLTDEEGRLYINLSLDEFDDLDQDIVVRIIPWDEAQDQSTLEVDTSAMDAPQGTYSAGEEYQVNGLVHFNFELKFEAYRYSLYDVLDTIIKQSRKRYNNKNTYNPCTLPSKGSNQGHFLDSIVAPDFDLTGCDLYTAIAEVLSFIDALPTLDADKKLGYEFVNDYSSEEIVGNVIADKKSSLNEERFANKLITKYQEAKVNKVHYYPSVGGFCRPSSKSLGILSPEDPVIKVDEKIDYIDQLDLYINPFTWTIKAPSICEIADMGYLVNWQDGVTTYQYMKFPNRVFLDITPSVFQKDIAELLPDGTYNASYPNKNNVITYNRGEKSIDIGKLVMTKLGSQSEAIAWAIRGALAVYIGWFDAYNPDEPYEPMFRNGAAYYYFNDDNGFLINYTRVSFTACYRVRYHAIYDGQVTAETIENKYPDGTIESSVSNAGCDLERLGVNMEGLANKLVNESVTISLGIKNYEDRIKKGMWIELNGDRYIANIVKTTFTTKEGVVTQDVQFVKNFNELSKFINLANQKMYYEIDKSLTTKGYENITEYVYISMNESEIAHLDVDESCISANGMKGLIYGTFNSNEKYSADFCVISIYRTVDDHDPIDIGKINGYTSISSDKFDRIEIPFHSYGFGNQVCLEVGFDDEICARYVVQYIDGFAVDDVNAVPVLYTNKDGYDEMFTFTFVKDSGFYEDAGSFPLVRKGKVDSTNLIVVPKYEYFKRANEILHFNYQIAFLPCPYTDLSGRKHYEEIFVGEKFTNENGIIVGNIENYKTKNFRFYYSNNPEDAYSINEKKGTGSYVYISAFDWNGMEGVPDGWVLSATLPSSITCDHWAICDEEGNVYISSNEHFSGSTLNLYVISSRSRV